jgi:hypothetical protein
MKELNKYMKLDYILLAHFQHLNNYSLINLENCKKPCQSG